MSSIASPDVVEAELADDPVDDGLALVLLQVGILQDLGDGLHRLETAAEDRREADQVRHRGGQGCEVRAEQHDLPRADGDEMAHRREAGDPEAERGERVE
jgi:hypothetical protein